MLAHVRLLGPRIGLHQLVPDGRQINISGHPALQTSRKSSPTDVIVDSLSEPTPRQGAVDTTTEGICVF